MFDKYCELTQKDANTGRITHKRLKFLKSKHECINKAISKKYRNNDRFPTYLDIIKLVKNCVDKNGLDLSPAELETESKYDEVIQHFSYCPLQVNVASRL